jgi:hypothetical protein
MDDWREMLALLKAQVAVHHMALRALVHSHPDPAAVLAEWRKIRADAVNAAYVLPSDERRSAWLGEHVHAFAEDWTAELVDAAAARETKGLEQAAEPAQRRRRRRAPLRS